MNDQAKLFLLTVVLAASLARPASAQTLPLQAAAPYLLGKDDVLSVQVANFPELSVPQATVLSDGKINVPQLDPVPVAGRTVDQVRKTLQAKYSKFYIGAFVTVSVIQRRHESVQIYGFVTHSQSVDYQPGLRLEEAVAAAGGAADNGDLTHVTITHKNGTVQTADVSSASTAAGTAQDIVLAPFDVVQVPERHLQISVLGEVAKPGAYVYKDKMNVLDALTDANNVTLATADLTHATLIHNGMEQPLDLKGLLQGGQMANNLPLAPGDRIFVPTLNNRIFVDGAVGHPGYYAFHPGDHLIDAISGSGGTVAGVSDTKKVTVIHQDKKKNTYVAQTVDYGKFLQHGDGAVNIALQPDDAIYIPVKGSNANPLQQLAGVVGGLTGLRVLTGH